MISFKNKYDVIVVGGGPAGSTTGALLAEKGHDVLILEKEKISPTHLNLHLCMQLNSLVIFFRLLVFVSLFLYQ